MISSVKRAAGFSISQVGVGFSRFYFRVSFNREVTGGGGGRMTPIKK